MQACRGLIPTRSRCLFLICIIFTLLLLGLRPRALPGRYIEMGRLDRAVIDPGSAVAALPPLIKGYLRLGGFVGDGAVIDEQFNTTDVCILVKSDLVTQKYSRHYERQSKDTWAA